MTAVYPIDKLPYPVRDSFSQQYGNGYTANQMDDNHRRMRRKFEMLPQNSSITWRFTWGQYNLWEAFLRYDCAQASGYFTIALYPAAPTYTYRLTGYPQSAFDENTNSWTVTGTVERIRVAPNAPAATGVLPQWPATLPVWEKSGYQINRDDTVSRSSITDGLANQISRFTEEVVVVAATLLLTESELAIFDAFVHDTLIGGLAPFSGYFANGTGTTLQRLNFIAAPKIESSGAAYKVTVSMEIRDIPVMSQLVYTGQNILTLSDTITYTATIAAKLGIQPNESMAFNDSVSFKIGTNANDSFSYSEAIAIIINAVRPLAESLTLSESMAFNIGFNSLNDSIVYKTNGQACYEDYATDWVKFGYDAKCNIFSVEEVNSENMTWDESVAMVLSFQRTFAESLTLNTVGNVSMDAYSSLYVSFGYTADAVATF